MVTLRPNVVGSAWIPWVRPIIGVSLYRWALRRSTSRKLTMADSINSEASLTWSAWAVSTTSVEVKPMWMNREEGPTTSETARMKATTS